MARAIELAGSPGAPHGPNPRVGCVLLAPDGTEVGAGFHRGAGRPHAEVEALHAAGPAASGSTAVVSLEPCAHLGRTGPCTRALHEAGVRRVVYAQADPDPVAAGGAGWLRQHGVEVEGGILADQAGRVNAEWTIAVSRRRPFVTMKTAATLDGRIAAADGSSRWITGKAARIEVHQLRNEADAVMVGTGTVFEDNPALTVRHVPLLGSQPVRIVVGKGEIPPDARVFDGQAPVLLARTHDPRAALDQAYEHGVRHVLLEAGPTLSAAMLRDGLVDRIRWYVAPLLLGSGVPAVGDFGVLTLPDARRWTIESMSACGDDVRLDLVPRRQVPHDGS